jgi:Protein of unknown function (DUF2894)
VSHLAELVTALRAAGGEVFDPLGFRLIESLVARAEILGGGARDRLLDRARVRIDALDSALREARLTAEQELRALATDGASIAPALREALARGEVARVRREIRRALSDRTKERERVQVPWLTRLRGAAVSRGARLPDELTRDLEGVGADDGSVDRGAHARAVAAGDALSDALFRESAESTRAMIAVARAADDVPDDAGPYNGQVLAAQALAVMAELAPTYVRVVVAMADDLAALEALLAPEAETAKGKTKAGKRRRAQAASPKVP